MLNEEDRMPQVPTELELACDAMVKSRKYDDQKFWENLADTIDGCVGSTVATYRVRHEPIFRTFEDVTEEFNRLKAESASHKLSDQEVIDTLDKLRSMFDLDEIQTLKETIKDIHQSIEHQLIMNLAHHIIEDAKPSFTRRLLLNENDDKDEISKSIDNFIEWVD